MMEANAVMLAIASGLLGAVCSLGVGVYFWQKSDFALALNEMIVELKEIEKLAVHFWSSADRSRDHLDPLGAELRGRISVLAAYEPLLKRCLKSKYSHYLELDVELFDATTGGAFDTSNVPQDHGRAVQSLEAASRIRALLRSARAGLNGPF